MFPWSAIVGLAGQAASGIMSAINNKKKAQEEDAAAARREAHYEAQANENPLSRADNRALLSQYDRDAKKQVETARNTATIIGATPEYGVAVQDAVADGRAKLMSNISAANQARVDTAKEKAEAAREAGEDARIKRKAERNATYAQLASNAVNAVGSIADAYSVPDSSVAVLKEQQSKLASGAAEKGIDLNAKSASTQTGLSPEVVKPNTSGASVIGARNSAPIENASTTVGGRITPDTSGASVKKSTGAAAASNVSAPMNFNITNGSGSTASDKRPAAEIQGMNFDVEGRDGMITVDPKFGMVMTNQPWKKYN